MRKNIFACMLVIALTWSLSAAMSFAQFGGRGGGLGGIFGGGQRGSRDRGGERPDQGRPIDRPVPDIYQQTEHQLALMEVDLRLSAEQQTPWGSFAQKVLAYASDLSRERARMGLPEGESVDGPRQIDQVLQRQRTRVTELEEIRNAANALYATFSTEQKRTADTRMQAIFSPGAAPPQRRPNN
jgi:hypothetical protein